VSIQNDDILNDPNLVPLADENGIAFLEDHEGDTPLVVSNAVSVHGNSDAHGRRRTWLKRVPRYIRQ